MRKYSIYLLFFLILFIWRSSFSLEKKDLLRIEIYPKRIKNGDVVLIKLKPLMEELKIIKIIFRNKSINFYKNKEREYFAILGIGLTIKSGRYNIDFIFQAKEKNYLVKDTIEVVEKKFKVQRLKLPSDMVDFKGDILRRVLREINIFKKLWKIKSKKRYWRGRFIIPTVGEIEDNFGFRRIINNRERSPHKGVDIKADFGEEVLSCNNGKVVLADNLYLCGNSIVIDHGYGLYTMYFHLSKILVNIGDLVKKGDLIGYVGDSGRALGAHLHWGVNLQGNFVNPLSLVKITSYLERGRF
jgi:murein DD-endopeptidase MepM/ murein hydrolase activator NlpD